MAPTIATAVGAIRNTIFLSILHLSGGKFGAPHIRRRMTGSYPPKFRKIFQRRESAHVLRHGPRGIEHELLYRFVELARDLLAE